MPDPVKHFVPRRGTPRLRPLIASFLAVLAITTDLPAQDPPALDPSAVEHPGSTSPVAAELPPGHLVVLGMADGSITVIDTATGERTAQWSTDVVPHEVCATPDGDQAFVMLYGDQRPGREILSIDLSDPGPRLGERVDLGPMARPHGCAATREGVWFTSEVARSIGHLDRVSGRLTEVIGHGARGGHMLALDEPRRRVFVAGISDREVVSLDLDGQGAVRRCELQNQAPEGIAVSPDGRTVVAVHRGVGVVTVIDADTMAVRGRLEVGGDLFRVVCPKGRAAVVSDPGNARLVLVDPVSVTTVATIPLPGGPAGLALSPDHGFLAASILPTASVVVVDLDSREVVAEFDVGANPDGICWAPPPGTEPPPPPRQGRLGVALAPVGEAEKERLVFEGEGAVFARIEPGSAAEAQGLAVGMVVVACDGVIVRDPYALIELLKGRLAGERVSFEVIDEDGEQRTIEVILG